MEKPYEIIDAKLRDLNQQQENLIRACEKVFADIFERFGITELTFSKPFLKFVALKDQKFTSMKYFDFEECGKKLQLFCHKYGYNFDVLPGTDRLELEQQDDYKSLLDAVLETINEYLSIGLPTSEWAIGLKSEAKRIEPIHEKVSAELNISFTDFYNVIMEKSNVYNEAIQMTKKLMTDNGYNRIIIPEEKVTQAIREFAFRTKLVVIDEDGMLRFYHEHNHIFGTGEPKGGIAIDGYMYPRVLRSVYESIEYYRAHPDEISEESMA